MLKRIIRALCFHYIGKAKELDDERMKLIDQDLREVMKKYFL